MRDDDHLDLIEDGQDGFKGVGPDMVGVHKRCNDVL